MIELLLQNITPPHSVFIVHVFLHLSTKTTSQLLARAKKQKAQASQTNPKGQNYNFTPERLCRYGVIHHESIISLLEYDNIVLTN